MNAQHEKYLSELLDQISDVNRVEVAEYLQKLLPRCHAKSRRTWWMWARIQLSKNGFHVYLHISELKLPPETVKPHQREGFTYAINNGVALIDVANDTDHAVWRVPLDKLPWALSMYPVSLQRLPALEPVEAAQIRKLKWQLKTRRPFMTPKQLQILEEDIKSLTALEKRLYPPVPRYQLLKYLDGGVIPVHRIYLDAGRDDQIKTVDGNFLNFATASYTRVEQPIVQDGLVVAKRRQPGVWSDLVTLPNLYIANSPAEQKDFEDKFLQAKLITWDGVMTNEIDVGPLRVQPNADYLAAEDESAPEELAAEPADAVEIDGKSVEGLAEQVGYGSEYLGLAPEPEEPDDPQTNLFEISAHQPTRAAIKGKSFRRGA